MNGTRFQKLFELLGVVPLGVYLVVHVAAYSRVLLGVESHGSAPSRGLWLVLEVALVWVPLALHAGRGLWLSFSPLATEPVERRRSVLLRVSGVLALGFLVQHALWLRAPLVRGEQWPSDLRVALPALLSTTHDGMPLVAALHVAGLGAVTAHFGWGLARCFERWGVLGARRARTAAGWLAALLFGLGVVTVVELATGSFMPDFVR